MSTRRQFLTAAGAIGIGTMSIPHAQIRAGDDDAKSDERDDKDEVEITATEDLMREHGILNRILLVYDEVLRRLRTTDDLDPTVIHATASLVRLFVEDYHERLEEKFIFPEFEKQNKLVDLVAILRRQHEAGRRITDVILGTATPEEFSKADSRRKMIAACEAFIRMYRPHEAREDTVLFPALHEIISAKRMSELGEQFEESEHHLFGNDGFAANVEKVVDIEKQLGIYDLAQFTPK